MKAAAANRRPSSSNTASNSGGSHADLLDLVQESLVIMGLDGRISRWNKASERLYGWSRVEAEGLFFADLFGDHWPTAEQISQTENGRIYEKELRRRMASGQEVIVVAQLSLRRGAAGQPLELVETTIDITAQRQAETEAANGELHYRNVFRAIPVSVWDVDVSEARAHALACLSSAVGDPLQWLIARPERIRDLVRLTRIVDVNDQAIKLFGPCAWKDLLGSAEPYWPNSSLPDFARWIISLLSSEPFFTCETRQRRHDGYEFDALFTASFPPNTVVGGRLVVSIVDNSEMKRGQAAVRESEAFYTDMFHGAAFSAWHLDATETRPIYAELKRQGVTDFRRYLEEFPDFLSKITEVIRVVDVNETTLRLFEASDRSEIIGGSISRYWLPDRLETLIGSLDASFNNRPNFEGLSRMRTVKGTEIDVLFTRSASSTLRSAGQLLLAIVDMTDKVQAQNALAEMQATFAHADRVSSLGELTASIAHEINQPLTAIAANGETATRWLAQPKPDLARLQSVFENIIADARRASDVVTHIRSMASPQVGLRRRVSLSKLVEDALTLLSPQLKKCGAIAVRELQVGLPDVLGDAVQLQQVIVNLVLNAAQAMSAKPCSRLTLRTWAVPDVVVMTIEDNGPGIQAKDLDRLFSSFFTTKTDGMGIGLAICRTIVEAHGGHIFAENMESGGARFTVRLPVL